MASPIVNLPRYSRPVRYVTSSAGAVAALAEERRSAKYSTLGSYIYLVFFYLFCNLLLSLFFYCFVYIIIDIIFCYHHPFFIVSAFFSWWLFLCVLLSILCTYLTTIITCIINFVPFLLPFALYSI